MKARDYQIKCDNAVEAALERHESTIVVAATGTGKTVICGLRMIRHRQRRFLFLAHRKELVEKAAETFAKMTGEAVAIEMAGRSVNTEIELWDRARIVCASVATMGAMMGDGSRRMHKFDPGEFDEIIIDESHHSVCQGYTLILDYFKAHPNLRWWGVTATPDRHDGQALRKIYKSVAFVYDIRQAITDGWLVPVAMQMRQIRDLDYSHVPTTAGDLDQRALSTVLEVPAIVEAMAREMIEVCKGKGTIVFAHSVPQAARWRDTLNLLQPESARLVTDKTPKDVRKQTTADFEAGVFPYLLNVDVFSEGYDVGGVWTVVMGKPTKSRAAFAQKVGRGTRPLRGTVDPWETPAERKAAIAASAKPSVLILDFVGNSGTHKLVTVADILGGNMAESVAKAARAGRVISDVLEEARSMRDIEEAEREKQMERVAMEAQDAAAQTLLNVKYKVEVTDIDPFNLCQVRHVEHGSHGLRPLTVDERLLLRNNGLDTQALSLEKARTFIAEIWRRRKAKVWSLRQETALARMGFVSDEMPASNAKQILQYMQESRHAAPSPAG
jgi:superfamily II DNA or RNA helicase